MNEARVSGMGVIAPNGIGTESYWEAVLEGRGGIGRIGCFDPTPYPVTLAGEVDGFKPAEHVPSRLLVETSTMSHLAFAAAAEALADAGADTAALDEYGLGVITANSTGGVEFGQRELENLWSNGPEHMSAYMSIAWFYAATSGQLSIRHKLRGHCGVVVADQAGGLDAIGQGRRALSGDQGLVLVGGTESPMSPAGLVSQIPTGRLSTRSDPDRAFLPFDADATGAVTGEGGAILVLESPEHARGRGAAQDHGAVIGHASTFDPRPGSGRPPALEQALRAALDDAGVAPGEVGAVFADAAGLPGPDLEEARAITAVFGPRGVPVTAPKALVGRLSAGAGPLDAVTALLACRDRVIPATPNVTELARGCEIDLVTGEPRAADPRIAVVLGRGHGGFNSALVVRGPRDPARSSVSGG